MTAMLTFFMTAAGVLFWAAVSIMLLIVVFGLVALLYGVYLEATK